ncbi:MAG: hypothetical protein ABS81_26980 [Pseudonocardia sp. SCN 72-86]|nr:MAG: hypothetical protein ABS81_26980 [Pseudonocardia sp. SCN 72-86]
MKATLTAEAAAALNKTFNVTLFAKGLSIGTAAVYARTGLLREAGLRRTCHQRTRGALTTRSVPGAAGERVLRAVERL